MRLERLVCNKPMKQRTTHNRTLSDEKDSGWKSDQKCSWHALSKEVERKHELVLGHKVRTRTSRGVVFRFSRFA